MTTMEEQLTHALEEAVRWKNYAEDLIKERDSWIAEYRAARAEVERLKIDRDLFRKERDIFKSELHNDGKSGEYRDPDMPNRNSGWSV